MNSDRHGSAHFRLTRMGTIALTLLGLSRGLGGVVATPGDSEELQVQVGKAFEITSSSGYNWFPTVHRFPTGEIMVTIRMTPEGIGPARMFTAYCISKDQGSTWSRRYTLGDEADVDGAWSVAPQADGKIWHLFMPLEPFPRDQSQVFHATLSKFSRNGTELTIDRNVVIRLAVPMHLLSLQSYDRRNSDIERIGKEISGFPWGPILDGLNGDLIAPIYYTAEEDPRYYRLGLIRSSDGGKTWTERSTIAAVEPGGKPWPGMGNEGPCEAGLVRLADKRLYTMFRTGGDAFIGQAWSSDDGATWTKPTSTPYKGVALRLRRLSNGVLACTTGRPGPVVMMFSLDGTGEKWSYITPIFGGKSTHYNDFIEVEPGKLLLVYDSIPYSWDAIPPADHRSENVIYGTFVDVHKR